MIKGRPPRLDQVFQSYDPPLYFVTLCTLHRQRIGDLRLAQDAFEQYGASALKRFNIAIGRYVIMPDHFHFFVRGGPDFVLGEWIKGLKRAISTALNANHDRVAWQPGFFDHILRNDESYSQKWEYVYENPVRAGLVRSADQWIFQGEIVLIDRA
jgi:REP element-mobilizing transposase RayT